MTQTSKHATPHDTTPDDVAEPDPVRACIARLTAAVIDVPRICLRRTCRRQRRCCIWIPDLDETDCADLLTEKPRALYDALRVEAEVIIDLLKERSPLPPPSPDPGQRWLQEEAIRIVLGTLAHFRVVERPLLRRFAANWRSREPALLQGDTLERFEALMRIVSAEPDQPTTEEPPSPDEEMSSCARPPAGNAIEPPGPLSAETS
ncbi:hypothetical protein ACO34A_11740 [Rhizobium sp. ACO-34A]|nr:hypothetical protein [Rhizobium sp. ACO-34A]ATN34473.1 hypothetical protein ACO34A_11740 [Rhizobium sp. ACO-34A]